MGLQRHQHRNLKLAHPSRIPQDTHLLLRRHPHRNIPPRVLKEYDSSASASSASSARTISVTVFSCASSISSTAASVVAFDPLVSSFWAVSSALMVDVGRALSGIPTRTSSTLTFAAFSCGTFVSAFALILTKSTIMAMRIMQTSVTVKLYFCFRFILDLHFLICGTSTTILLYHFLGIFSNLKVVM